MFGAARLLQRKFNTHTRQVVSTSLRDITRTKREKLLARPFEI